MGAKTCVLQMKISSNHHFDPLPISKNLIFAFRKTGNPAKKTPTLIPVL